MPHDRTPPTMPQIRRVLRELDRLRYEQLPLPKDPELLASLNATIPWLETLSERLENPG